MIPVLYSALRRDRKYVIGCHRERGTTVKKNMQFIVKHPDKCGIQNQFPQACNDGRIQTIIRIEVQCVAQFGRLHDDTTS
jgi:hypothetical protein